MAGKTDQVKGQVKEAVGSLTGDKDLESEGKADRRLANNWASTSLNEHLS
jgi:uncharacterized protein YjbJ (UPF0337 family)